MTEPVIRPHAIRHPDRFFIGGEWVEPSTSSKIEVRDSGTEEVFLVVAEAQRADIDRAVAAARKAFDNGPWPLMSHAERGDWLNRIADRWEAKNAGSLAANWTREAGALHSLTARAAPGLAHTFREHARLAETFAWREEHVSSMGEPALIVREPVGVVAAIVPWNGPNVPKCAAALITGCTVILKASPEAPSWAYYFAEVCEEVGLPAGVLNILTADRAVSEQLVKHPDVDKVSFTGSTTAGRRIASLCGERIARCTLELGGKSPAIILDDFDLGVAAKTIAGGARALTGQVCSSLTRLIVSRDRHDRFIDALADAFGSTRVGDPFDPASEMGPLAIERQRDRVEDYIAKGKAEGARLVIGGRRPAHLNRGYFIEPTIFANVDNDMTIARDEIFGPVLSVIPADNEKHAIAIANDTIYGLNSSIFTNDPNRAYALGRRIRAGTVGQNGWRTDFSVGFGGFKQSGLGREGGRDGLHPYLEAKTMIFHAMPSV